MHLKGLEQLTLTTDHTVIRTGIRSTGDHASWCEVSTNGTAFQPAATNSPLRTTVEIVDGATPVTLPLSQGHFRVTVPPALLSDDTDALRIEWIDFWR